MERNQGFPKGPVTYGYFHQANKETESNLDLNLIPFLFND